MKKYINPHWNVNGKIKHEEEKKKKKKKFFKHEENSTKFEESDTITRFRDVQEIYQAKKPTKSKKSKKPKTPKTPKTKNRPKYEKKKTAHRQEYSEIPEVTARPVGNEE